MHTGKVTGEPDTARRGLRGGRDGGVGRAGEVATAGTTPSTSVTVARVSMSLNVEANTVAMPGAHAGGTSCARGDGYG